MTISTKSYPRWTGFLQYSDCLIEPVLMLLIFNFASFTATPYGGADFPPKTKLAGRKRRMPSALGQARPRAICTWVTGSAILSLLGPGGSAGGR